MKSFVALISNPVAKGASERKIEEACRFLESKGYGVEKLTTRQRGEAESLAKEAVTRGSSFIIAAGGDGTFNEVANGIAGSEVPMAILPLGTTNVLAKEIGIPENVESAMKIAVSRTPKSVSLGKIVITRTSSFVSRYFILMAGIGFDGEAVFGISEALKKISGKGAYIYSGIRTLLRFNPSELHFDINGGKFSGYSVVIGNGAKYGGNFRVTPHASLSDPALDICLFKGKRRLDILRYASGIVLGNHLAFKDVEYRKAKKVDILGSAHIQIDGDYFGMSPAWAEAAPGILRLIY